MKTIDQRKQTIRLLKNSIKVHLEKLSDPTLNERIKANYLKTVAGLQSQLKFIRGNKYSSSHYQFIPNDKPNRKQRRARK